MTAVAGLAGLAFRNVHRAAALEHDLTALRAELDVEHSLIGESAAMTDVYALIAKAARSDSTVLITGASNATCATPK